MVLCKFEKHRWKCPFEVEDGEDYCYWHLNYPYLDKVPTKEQINEIRNREFNGAYLECANLNNLLLSAISFKDATLSSAKLNNTRITLAMFNDSYLNGVELKNAVIDSTNFERADLSNASLNDTIIGFSNLNSAVLYSTNLRGTNLYKSNLNNSCLINAIFDSESVLDYATLVKSNLYKSYIDKTSSFRNATFFETTNLDEMEINEFIADNCYSKKSHNQLYTKEIVFDAYKIKSLLDKEGDSEHLFTKLNNIGVLKNINWGKNPANQQSNPFQICSLVRDATKTCVINRAIFYTDILDACKNGQLTLEDKAVFDRFVTSKHCMGFNYFVPTNTNLLAEVDKIDLYSVSIEVYSKLFRFYSNEGMDFEAKHVHYRSIEAKRKLLLVRNKLYSTNGIFDRLVSSAFYWFFLKIHVGHGDKISNPIKMSVFWIILFGGIFALLKGVDVNSIREVRLFDYLFLSVITFTGSAFANVQPDITIPLMQPLIMLESIIGFTMMAVIIFAVTYQISR